MQDQRDAEARAAELSARYGRLDGAALLEPLIEREFPGLTAAVSSFGAESALLLSLVAEVDPSLPVIFLETGKHFRETRQYRDTLIESLDEEVDNDVDTAWRAEIRRRLEQIDSGQVETEAIQRFLARLGDEWHIQTHQSQFAGATAPILFMLGRTPLLGRTARHNKLSS